MKNSASCRKGRGVGLACSAYLTGAGLPIYWNKMPHSGVQLKLDRGGGVTVFCGSTEIGQGSDDVLAAIVAEVLGLDTFDIRVYTRAIRILGPSIWVRIRAASRSWPATRRCKRRTAPRICSPKPSPESLDVPKERLRFAEKRVFDSAAPEKRVAFQEAVCLAEATFRHDRNSGLVHAAEISRALSKAAASGHRRRIRTPPRSWKSS